MIVIRPQQIAVFQAAAEAAFERRVVAYLRERHADVSVQLPAGAFAVKEIPQEDLRGMVRGGLERARGYGITWQSTLIGFVVLMFMTAPNFDRHPLVRFILKDESVPADLRVAEFWERTTEQNWAAVRQSYDADSWNPRPRDGAE